MDQIRNAKTNALNIGMNKDVDPIFLKEGQYLNAINAKLNSQQGDYALIQNEPSNFSCLNLTYDFVGSIPLPGGKYAIFSTTDFYSEIGIFDDINCLYKVLITKNTCLNFKKQHLISGRAKENFDCSISIYWTDNYNPRRYLNLDNLPYEFTEANDACKTKTYTNIIDCQSMLIQPLLKYPNVSASLGTDGNIKNGVYEVAVAYSINSQRITDYMSITSPIQVFSHENFGRSIEVDIQNLDTNFDEYELIVIYTIDGTTAVDKIGIYDTAQSKVIVTAIGPTATRNTILTLDEVIRPSVNYEKAEDVTSTSEYLIWINPSTDTELNYQKIANNITTKWVAYTVSANYYKRGGTKVSYMRDEQYTFAIQWLYNTGFFSPGYHIPGRKADSSDLDRIINNDVYEIKESTYDGKTRPKLWQVYNTAYSTPLEGTNNDINIIAEGRMGYWESTDRYPDNEELFPGTMKCAPIRHHKFPDNSQVYMTTQPDTGEEKLILLGVRFEDIHVPLDTDGNPRKDIVGYRIVRGDRYGNKTVIGKGLLYNMGSYKDENGDQVLYPNYAYNDLRTDPYLSVSKTYTSGSREKNFKSLSQYQFDKYTFHSPSFSFNNPSPGSELKIEGEVYGTIKGKFTPVYKHPKHKLITNFAAGIAVLIGLSEGYVSIKGRTCTKDEYEAKTTVIIPTVGYKRSVYKCETALTKLSVIPFVGLITGIIGGILAYGYYFNQGVDASLKIIKAFGQYQQYAYQFNSHGFYDKFDLPQNGNIRRKIVYGQYLLPGMQSANAIKVNNFQRESSLFLQTDSPLAPTIHLDKSRQTITDFGACKSDSKAVNTQAASYYGSVKRSMVNQYGQLDSINYLDTGSGINYINQVDKVVKSNLVFGGDTYVSRFTVKRKMPFFLQNLAESQTNQDGTEFDYMKYYNIPYPRFWINTEEYDAEEVRSLKLASKNHNFDCRNAEQALFIIKGRYFYLYNSGIADFYVESEYNLDNRDWDTTINGRHYDRFTYTDFNDLLRSDKITYDNKYIFDNTYLKQLQENFIPKQRRDFDPILANTCFTTFKNRVIYSAQATKEQIKDNWRVYLPNNYYDFSKENGNLTTVKTFGTDRLIFLFDKSSPYITPGIDSLTTANGASITLGDNDVFARKPQKIGHTDYAYGSSQSRWAFNITQYGGFYPSQRQGKVFAFNGAGIDDIAKLGMKNWFKQNLPSRLVSQFTNYKNQDNPIVGVAVVSVFDNTDEIYYLSKTDYQINPLWLSRTKYDPEKDQFYIGSTPIKFKDPNFFDDCSWTLSFDVNQKAWISFHDWHPSWTFQTENNFITYANRGLWKHNAICNSYCNFYGKAYPFEIEFSVSNGQQTSILASLEWNLEAYKYTSNCIDAYHLLDYNFDELIIHNSEQNSGLVKLFPRPKQITSPYPLNYTNRTEVEYSKVEQKYRVNQFTDLTRDRGEFSGKQIPMFNSEPNGYRKTLNRLYFDYNKDQFQRKKFRHNTHKVILRKNNNTDVKMIFKFNNAKQTASFR